jgi:hypothetical protein
MSSNFRSFITTYLPTDEASEPTTNYKTFISSVESTHCKTIYDAKFPTKPFPFKLTLISAVHNSIDSTLTATYVSTDD